MAPLFFALAAASSEASGAGGGRLALLPGAPGWQSARCCTYPQELLLQLERGAEVHEVEVAVRGELAPRAVEVHLSREGDFPGDTRFEHAGTLHFDPEPAAARRSSTARRARLKLFALCSGQVRILVHEPLATGAGNPYKQVALASLALWGYEDATSAESVQPGPGLGLEELGRGDAGDLGGDVGEVARVLMELGIPLSVVPLDEDDHRFAEADPATRRLLGELQRRQPQLLRSSKMGEAQQLQEHILHLSSLGAELRSLLQEREKLLAARRREEALRLAAPISALEERRLRIAALYETEFWFEEMASKLSDPGGGLSDPPLVSPI